MKKPKSSEFLNVYFTNALCWLWYNQREVLLLSLQNFLSHSNHTQPLLFGNKQCQKLSYLPRIPCDHNMLIYAKTGYELKRFANKIDAEVDMAK